MDASTVSPGRTAEPWAIVNKNSGERGSDEHIRGQSPHAALRVRGSRRVVFPVMALQIRLVSEPKSVLVTSTGDLRLSA